MNVKLKLNFLKNSIFAKNYDSGNKLGIVFLFTYI